MERSSFPQYAYRWTISTGLVFNNIEKASEAISDIFFYKLPSLGGLLPFYIYRLMGSM